GDRKAGGALLDEHAANAFAPGRRSTRVNTTNICASSARLIRVLTSLSPQPLGARDRQTVRHSELGQYFLKLGFSNLSKGSIDGDEDFDAHAQRFSRPELRK